MDKAIAEKWVAALRSGKYKKGRGRLVDSKERYCCLGVLCDIAIKNGVPIVRSTDGFSNLDDGYYNHMVLPSPVMEWAGMDSDDGEYYDHNGKGHTLVDVNDNLAPKRRKGFKFIADIIERNFRSL